jgi:MFS family permease
VAAAGAALTLVASLRQSFGLLLLAMLLFGGATASGLQARYAATDAAPASSRARALSVVVWATTVGAVAGPNLSEAGADVAGAMHLPALAGPFVFSLVAFLAAVAVLLALLRPDPASVPEGAGGHVPLRTVLRGVRGPDAVLGLTSVAIAHAVMVGVMVMTPVHLHDGGASLHVVGLVISSHIAGMYALSPVFGVVADRYGRHAGIGLGVCLLAAALSLAATSGPHAHVRLGVALAGLGLGWSACLVAGSTLLSESVHADVRTGVQGVSDLVMGLVGAGAGAVSGPLLAARGYPALSVVAVVLLAPVVVLLARASPGRLRAQPG